MDEINIPKKLVPKAYKDAKYGGVFLLFITGKSEKHVLKKVEQAKKLAEIIKLT